MKARLCDRCGEKVVGVFGIPLWVKVIRPNVGGGNRTHDLCNRCGVELKQWLTDPECHFRAAESGGSES